MKINYAFNERDIYINKTDQNSRINLVITVGKESTLVQT